MQMEAFKLFGTSRWSLTSQHGAKHKQQGFYGALEKSFI